MRRLVCFWCAEEAQWSKFFDTYWCSSCRCDDNIFELDDEEEKESDNPQSIQPEPLRLVLRQGPDLRLCDLGVAGAADLDAVGLGHGDLPRVPQNPSGHEVQRQ